MTTVFRTSFYSICLLCYLVSFVQAEEEKVVPAQVQYYELKPSFVANFGDSSTTRLSFIKTDVTARAYSDEAVSVIKLHDALIRHQIVMILSAQSGESLAASDGQEALRKAIVTKVKAVLEEETGKEQIDDLLFTSFVVQR